MWHYDIIVLWCHTFEHWHHAQIPLRSYMISTMTCISILPCGRPKSGPDWSWLLCHCPTVAPCRPLSIDALYGLLLLSIPIPNAGGWARQALPARCYRCFRMQYTVRMRVLSECVYYSTAKETVALLISSTDSAIMMGRRRPAHACRRLRSVLAGPAGVSWSPTRPIWYSFPGRDAGRTCRAPGTGRQVENSGDTRRIAFGESDELLPHHSWFSHAQNKNNCQQQQIPNRNDSMQHSNWNIFGFVHGHHRGRGTSRAAGTMGDFTHGLQGVL